MSEELVEEADDDRVVDELLERPLDVVTFVFRQ
jgi:hypothetical protein